MPSRTTLALGLAGLVAVPFTAVQGGPGAPGESAGAAQPGVRSAGAIHQVVDRAPTRTAGQASVRLVTGDRVVLDPSAGSYGRVIPGPGRADMKFLTYRYAGRVEVIPADVFSKVTSGRLDRRLFDVRGLAAAGFRDARQAVATLAQSPRRAAGPESGSAVPAQAEGRPAAAGPVVAMPARLSFGVQRWPHADDRPRTRLLTYRNVGSERLHLSLRTELVGPDGRPAPRRALTLRTGSLDLAPGGRAQVRVVVDTRHGGPDGRYTGRVIATSRSGSGPRADRPFVTPLSVSKEVESYDLTINHLDRSGASTDVYGDLVFGLDHDLLDFPMGHGDTTRLRLPKGRYHVESTVASGDRDDPDFHTVVRPLLALDRDIALTVDARVTKPVSISLPRKSARLALVDLAYIRRAPNGRTLQSGILSHRIDETFTAHQGPEVGSADLIDRIHTQWAEPDGQGGFAGTPYVYGLCWLEHGRYLTGFTRQVRTDELARVTSRHASDQAGVRERDALRFLAPLSAEGIGGWSVGLPVGLPSTLTAYLTTGEIRWNGSLVRTEGSGRDRVEQTWLSSGWQSYAPRRAYTERWNAAVIGPSLAGATATVSPRGSIRGRPGGRMLVDLPMYADQDGHLGGSLTDTARTTLYRDGVTVGRSQEVGQGEFAVPLAPATYRLETSATRSTVSQLSTRVEAAWTFRSAVITAGPRPLPLTVLRFGPRVDDHNRFRGGRASLIPVTVEPNGSSTPAVRRLTVRVSTTDGRSWQDVPVVQVGTDRWAAVVSGRPGCSSVSLRATAVDAAGNRSELTIIRAYARR